MTVNKSLLQIVYNEPSFCLGTASTRLCVTRTAGMMAPVTFFADSETPIQPYYIAPWWNEGCAPEIPTLLASLRGDFFCAPFGGNEAPHRGITYPPHGEAANSEWALERVDASAEGAALHLNQAQKLQPGLIRKSLAVLEGQSVVYSRHELTGMEGPMCIGHHPNLFIPEEAGQGYLSHAPHRYAHTYIHPTERPEAKGYSLLRPDTPIEDLTKVPTITGETADLTRYPARRGFEDIAIVCAAENLALGWTAFALPALGYVWFSLKDPRVLASSLMWMSNGGRHFPPWSGRNINTIGLEEITGFFHEGLEASAKKNFLSQMGIPTCVTLAPQRALAVNFIQGVVRIKPEFKGDFTHVRSIEPLGEQAIRLTSAEGNTLETAVNLSFIRDGKLKDLIE